MAATQTHPNDGAKTGIRVLVVEDQPLIAFDLISEIKSGQHEVVGQCATADKAVSLAGALKPDIIVMDIGLIGQDDGLQAARQIRAQYGIGCIFVSATLDRVSADCWAEIKPVALIRKPYRDNALGDAIAKSAAP